MHKTKTLPVGGSNPQTSLWQAEILSTILTRRWCNLNRLHSLRSHKKDLSNWPTSSEVTRSLHEPGLKIRNHSENWIRTWLSLCTLLLSVPELSDCVCTPLCICVLLTFWKLHFTPIEVLSCLLCVIHICTICELDHSVNRFNLGGHSQIPFMVSCKVPHL